MVINIEIAESMLQNHSCGTEQSSERLVNQALIHCATLAHLIILSCNILNTQMFDEVFIRSSLYLIFFLIPYSTSAIAVKRAKFGQGSGPIWLSDMNCLGTEVAILECPGADLGVADCTHSNDAGVSCIDPSKYYGLMD